jgi:hypothetical protein
MYPINLKKEASGVGINTEFMLRTDFSLELALKYNSLCSNKSTDTHKILYDNRQRKE